MFFGINVSGFIKVNDKKVRVVIVINNFFFYFWFIIMDNFILNFL